MEFSLTAHTHLLIWLFIYYNAVGSETNMKTYIIRIVPWHSEIIAKHKNNLIILCKSVSIRSMTRYTSLQVLEKLWIMFLMATTLSCLKCKSNLSSRNVLLAVVTTSNGLMIFLIATCLSENKRMLKCYKNILHWWANSTLILTYH